MLRKTLLIALLSALAAPMPRTASAQQAPPADMDRFVADVLRTFDVPGVAVAVVKDGKVVLAKGYGVKEKGKPALVDATTQFGIASNTKIFTATALGLLVEEGKIGWDRPVIDYLPWFRLSDPYVTSQLTIRDLLVHRSGLGLGAGDLLWWPASTYTRAEVARRLRFIPLATSFRSAYAYDNVLYLIAGEVIEAVSGQSWEDFVKTRIVDRIGMTQTAVRHSAALAAGNVATPHASVEGVVRAIQPFGSDNTNPAGGIMSGAGDMAKWMIVQLDSGRIGTQPQRLFTPGTARQLWTLVTPIGFGAPAPELAPLRMSFNGYALGLGVRDYRGQKLLQHTGGLPGYLSRVFMMPDSKLGVAVLTNQESGYAFDAIALHVLDHYLNAPPHDWLGGYRAVEQRESAGVAAADRAAAAARDSLSRPSLPLASYAATYRDPWYGDVVIEQGAPAAGSGGTGLVIRFTKTPSMVGDLVHWQHDTFVARWRDRELRADAYATFALNPDGTIRDLRMAPASPSVDFSFDFQDLRLVPIRR
jgi:CubicO group peptidase (beta-lactamase class C family)